MRGLSILLGVALAIVFLGACTPDIDSPEYSAYELDKNYPDKNVAVVRLFGLRVLTPSIAEYRQLVVLTIWGYSSKHLRDQLSSLPPELGALPNLRVLDLLNNNFVRLPTHTLSALPQLEAVYVSRNPLSRSELARARSELPAVEFVFLGNVYFNRTMADAVPLADRSVGAQQRRLAAACNQQDATACGSLGKLHQFQRADPDHLRATSAFIQGCEAEADQGPAGELRRELIADNCVAAADNLANVHFEKEAVYEYGSVESVEVLGVARGMYRRACTVYPQHPTDPCAREGQMAQSAQQFEMLAIQRKREREIQREQERQATHDTYMGLIDSLSTIAAGRPAAGTPTQAAATGGGPATPQASQTPTPGAAGAGGDCSTCISSPEVMRHKRQCQSNSPPAQRACYLAEAALCQCHLDRGGCGTDPGHLRACVQDATRKANALQ